MIADRREELQEDSWDREMERDFAEGGRGAYLVDEVDRQIEDGRCLPFDEARLQPGE